MISTGPSVAVSLWSTCAIAYKTWQFNSMQRSQVVIVNRRSRVEFLLHTLIDSGLAYTVLWGVFFGEALADSAGEGDPGFALGWLEVIMSVVVPVYPMWILMLTATTKEETKPSFRTLDPVTMAGPSNDISLPEYKTVRSDSP